MLARLVTLLIALAITLVCHQAFAGFASEEPLNRACIGLFFVALWVARQAVLGFLESMGHPVAQ